MLIKSGVFSGRRASVSILVTLAVYILIRHRGSRPVGAPWGENDGREPLVDETQDEQVSIDEDRLRDQFQEVYDATKSLASYTDIYGSTLNALVNRNKRKAHLKDTLTRALRKEANFTSQTPFRFNPYPAYNSRSWRSGSRGEYVPCEGASGQYIEDLVVFKGRPSRFPAPAFGSYEVLGMDGNLCFERETRLGPYGFAPQMRDGVPLDWDAVNWGDLQRRCLDRNRGRYDFTSRGNDFLDLYPKPNEAASDEEDKGHSNANEGVRPDKDAKWGELVEDLKVRFIDNDEDSEDNLSNKKPPIPSVGSLRGQSNLYKHHWTRLLPLASPGQDDRSPESRTALLLRSYTGKEYTDNDKHVIRSLITELSLRSGGEFDVFLLLHVKDEGIDIHDKKTRKKVLKENVPPEFVGITILWNDELVWKIYPALTEDEEKSVHFAQWLSVQWFSQEHPEYDYVWNWEMDFRFTGHHYDLVRKIESFAKKQPRRGLWERNDRYYIESTHGAFDTTFRSTVERRSGNETMWGPPPIPFIKPVGPKPPVSDPRNDRYEWGVGENADLITLGPIFNPDGSDWIFSDHVWGYDDENHASWELPRRGTIITHSRLSKRLLDIMHVENLRGNHVISEMTPQTVALIHGLKAVYAPHPVFFDRSWSSAFLSNWFNPGPQGTVGGHGSPVGWGRERRYQGSTWYYRAEPPNRLYNNWMGFEDTGIGGKAWEEAHGRACLPPMLLHPVKEVKETPPGYQTAYDIYD